MSRESSWLLRSEVRFSSNELCSVVLHTDILKWRRLRVSGKFKHFCRNQDEIVLFTGNNYYRDVILKRLCLCNPSFWVISCRISSRLSLRQAQGLVMVASQLIQSLCLFLLWMIFVHFSVPKLIIYASLNRLQFFIYLFFKCMYP